MADKGDKKDDKKAHETLLAVGTVNTGKDAGLSFGGDDYSFITTAEAYEIFKEYPEVVMLRISMSVSAGLPLTSSIQNL